MKILISVLKILIVSIILSGCSIDLFNSGCRALKGSGYSLCRSDDEKALFYLEPNHQPPFGGGILAGTVQSIAWNDRVIVANRHSTFRGDPDGLMIVDIVTGKVDGPFNQEIVAKKYPSIKLSDPADVWKTLR